MFNAIIRSRKFALHQEDTAETARDPLTKGALGGALFITTDDARKTFDTLSERGVDVTDEPADQPYGIDFGIRDPFGNAIRVGQLFDRVEG